MKNNTFEKMLKQNMEGFNMWTIAKPVLLGFAFGAGCYVAKVIIQSPILGSITNLVVKGAEKSAS